MKRFKYRAESYLGYLTHLRDLALLDAKEAETYVEKVKQDIEGRKDQVDSALERNSQFNSKEDNIHWIHQNNTFVKSLRMKTELLQDELLRAEEVYREKFESLLELQKQVKSVQTHRAHKKVDHAIEAKKRDQKILDDLNSLRSGGKRAKSAS